MQWFIMGRDMHVLSMPSTDSPDSLPLYNDKQTVSISNNTVVSTYEFTVDQEHNDAQYLQLGGYIAFVDKYNEMKMYTLMSHQGDDIQQTWIGEDIGMDLINATADKITTTEAHPIAWYLENYPLKGTGWTIGLNEISNLSRKLSFDGQSDSQLTRLGDIANQFDGAEISFSVEMQGNHITSQVINIHKKVGSPLIADKYVNDIDLKSLTYNGTIDNLCTSMLAYGSTPESKGEDTTELPPITFKDIAYDDGRYYSPIGKDRLYDRQGKLNWSRFRGFNHTDEGEFDGYINGIFTYDTTDPQELLNRTLTELKSRNTPQETYEADLLKIDADIGDYVQIAHSHYNPPIYLRARIQQVENCYTAEGQDTGILGDYTRLQSQIDPRVQQMLDGLANQFKYSYTWLRYAKDDKGTGMTATPTTDTKYVAIIGNKPTAVPSDDPTDYAGHWQLIKGNDGKDGIPGATGADGKTSYTHFAYANNVSGTADFSLDDPTGRSYMGVYSDFTKADSNNPSDYVWSLTKGRDGLDGTQGIPGKPGADGKTPYTHVAYADDDKGGGFSQSPDNKAYMGWYSDFTEADSNDPTKYGWSLIKGADGKDGADGVAGKDGVGVKTTTITYAQSTSGTTPPTTGWTASVPTLIKGQYLWTKTVWTYSDNTTETGYTVSYNAKDGNNGSDGVAGKDGVGISSTTITYQASTSGTTAPTGTWVSSPPSVPGGNYLWTKTVWSYTDNTSETGYSVAKSGEKGDRGLQGLQGTDGKDGIPGKPGADGKNSYTHIAYAESSDTERNMNNWTLSEPAKWATTIIYKDGTNIIDYKGVGYWENFGMPIKAKKGTKFSFTFSWSQPATSGYFSVYLSEDKNGASGSGEPVGVKKLDLESAVQTNKIYTIEDTATTDTMYLVFTGGPVADGVQYQFKLSIQQDFSQDPGDHEYMGWYSDFTQADSNDPSLYGWNLIKGANGSDGTPGRAGADGRTPYFHTAWATANGGTSGFSTTDSAGKSYLGVYTDFTQADSTNPSVYTWSLIKGADGANGAPGKPGADGKTPYFHQAWADSKDGNVNFSTTDPTNRGYLGTYSDFTQADSTDPSKYYWVELVGNLQIGGRNYILDSNQSISLTGNGKPNNNSSDSAPYTFSCGTLDKLPIPEGGGSAVLSVDYAITGSTPSGSAYFGFNTATLWELGAVTIVDISKVAKTGRVSAVIPTSSIKSTPANLLRARLDNVPTTVTVEFSKPKLEIANKPSDWQPAPEDTQGQIDTINKGLSDTNSKIAAVTKVDSQATAPTNPKKGDQWWVKDANGNINAFKIWDGAKWADSIIQQSAMNISTLNGNTINGATINGSKFTNSFTLVEGAWTKTGVTTIEKGSIMIDSKRNDSRVDRLNIDANGTVQTSYNSNGSLLSSASLTFDSLNLVSGSIQGDLTASDVETTPREVWTTHSGGDGDQIMGLTKQFRRVWFDGRLFIPQGQWNGNIGNYNKVLQIKNHKLYPKSNKIIGVTTLGNNSETASIQVQPDGWIVVVWSSKPQRILVEGCFYTLDF